MAKQMDFKIEPHMTPFLENELLQAKKSDSSMDASSMSLWLTVSPPDPEIPPHPVKRFPWLYS